MESNKILTVLVVALAILMLAFGFAINANVKNTATKADISKMVSDEVAKISVPTAEEIAALIPEITVPEVEVPEFKSDSYVNDLWYTTFKNVSDELEEEAYDAAIAEYDEDDLIDFLEANIEGFDDLEDADLSALDDDETVITITALGIKEDSDKSATVVFEIEIEYTLKEGMSVDYKDTVIATATVLFEDGDFDEEDVELEFSL